MHINQKFTWEETAVIENFEIFINTFGTARIEYGFDQSLRQDISYTVPIGIQFHGSRFDFGPGCFPRY